MSTSCESLLSVAFTFEVEKMFDPSPVSLICFWKVMGQGCRGNVDKNKSPGAGRALSLPGQMRIPHGEGHRPSAGAQPELPVSPRDCLSLSVEGPPWGHQV